jgi:AcrR family transcriptional regulator
VTGPDGELPVSTRERILTAAAELFRRRGYAATGIKAILQASRAPYGSLYHFFPGGKQEVGVAVIESSGAAYREMFETFYDGPTSGGRGGVTAGWPRPGDVAGDRGGVVEATARLFAGAADLVEATDYADACPIATLALEVASSSEPMRAAAAAAFESWLDVLTDRLLADGVPAPEARALAVEVFCLIEGAFLLARTIRSAEPIRQAGEAACETIRRALAGRAA